MTNRRVVIITGGSKGFGREISRLYQQRGDIVYICARDQNRLEETVAMLDPSHSQVFGIQADISREEDCCRIIDTVIAEQGRIDILLNNAGMAMRGTVEETDPSVMRAMVNINVLGSAYMSHFALPHLIQSRGIIHFTSSLAGLHGLPKVGIYCASKGALTQLSESIRAEVSAKGVSVGITYVGFTENDPDKVVYSADGSYTQLAPRRNSQTQQETARAIVRAIDKRKSVNVLTKIGKLAAFAYRFFPRISDVLMVFISSRT